MVVTVSSSIKTRIKFEAGTVPDMEDYGRPFRPSMVDVWVTIDGKGTAPRTIVFVKGRRVLKSGELGKQMMSRSYGAYDGPPPAWVEALIEEAGA